jgi:alpha-L-glutamate ligase-like protein/uncharacterized protein (TIGR02421 family)
MFSFLRNHGVLGLNARNLLYVKPLNPKKVVAFADDKLKTKAFLSARGIPTAKIYGRIETREQLHSFDFSALPDHCVLKPNHGFGGEGIIILKGRKGGHFLERGKHPIHNKELAHHIEDIIDGKFSMGGRRDEAFFEHILVQHECFAPFRPMGLPDLRIVVLNLVPVMAMLRIPTAQSHGKANMHLGGIGIGIDMSKGMTTHAAQYHGTIDKLPNGGDPSGIEIPFWEEILLICSKIQHITNIGYLAVDLTIDEQMGPVLLEVNARAGLMVQVANLAPLQARLERVKGLKVTSPEKGVRLAQDLFGERVDRGEEPEIGRPVLGTREVIQVAGDGVQVDVPCLIAPEQEHTVFSSSLVRKLQKNNALEIKDKKEKTYRVKFTLKEQKIQTLIHEGKVSSASVRASVGKRDLTGFLIDPTKEPEHTLIHSSAKKDLRAVDKLLAKIDHELLLLKFLKPINLREERMRIRKDEKYNPVFMYKELPDDIDETEDRLEKLEIDDSPLGILFEKKRRELITRIGLLRARGDAIHFTENSFSLFGSPTSDLIEHAESHLDDRKACDLPPLNDDLLTGDEAAPFFEEVLHKYGLHEWQVSVRVSLVADCTVGKKNVYIRRGARFSREHIDSLIAHEIETHVLTAENGNHQPFELFRRGCAQYLDTQEGLAIYNQNRVLSEHHELRYRSAKSVLATEYALEHSFADLRDYLMYTQDGYSDEKAITTAIALKRGLGDTQEPGAFTRSLVYFRGWSAINEFVAHGGDLTRLYIGKIAVEDLELVEQVPGIKTPLIIPEFLR